MPEVERVLHPSKVRKLFLNLLKERSHRSGTLEQFFASLGVSLFTGHEGNLFLHEAVFHIIMVVKEPVLCLAV